MRRERGQSHESQGKICPIFIGSIVIHCIAWSLLLADCMPHCENNQSQKKLMQMALPLPLVPDKQLQKAWPASGLVLSRLCNQRRAVLSIGEVAREQQLLDPICNHWHRWAPEPSAESSGDTMLLTGKAVTRLFQFKSSVHNFDPCIAVFAMCKVSGILDEADCYQDHKFVVTKGAAGSELRSPGSQLFAPGRPFLKGSFWLQKPDQSI